MFRRRRRYFGARAALIPEGRSVSSEKRDALSGFHPPFLIIIKLTGRCGQGRRDGTPETRPLSSSSLAGVRPSWVHVRSDSPLGALLQQLDGLHRGQFRQPGMVSLRNGEPDALRNASLAAKFETRSARFLLPLPQRRRIAFLEISASP